MIFDVLGLGESLSEYTWTDNKKIGVNDIYNHVCVDYLVLIDKPERFTNERLNVILESTPDKFYTHLTEWRTLISNYQEIKLAGPRGSIENIEGNDVCYSNNSTYVAVVLAYKMGATEINIFGADFNTHPNFKSSMLEIAIDDFKQLFLYLKSKGIIINASEGSRLKELI